MTQRTTHIRPIILLAIAAVAVASVLMVACGSQSTDSAGKQPSGSTESLRQAPLFKLPDANAPAGTEISLSQFKDSQLVVLVFYRAHW